MFANVFVAIMFMHIYNICTKTLADSNNFKIYLNRGVIFEKLSACIINKTKYVTFYIIAVIHCQNMIDGKRYKYMQIFHNLFPGNVYTYILHIYKIYL